MGARICCTNLGVRPLEYKKCCTKKSATPKQPSRILVMGTRKKPCVQPMTTWIICIHTILFCSLPTCMGDFWSHFLLRNKTLWCVLTLSFALLLLTLSEYSSSPSLWSIRLEGGGGEEAGRSSRPADS